MSDCLTCVGCRAVGYRDEFGHIIVTALRTDRERCTANKHVNEVGQRMYVGSP